MQKYYLASSRELARLESIAKSPVIHQFSETISGAMTIRGFRKQSMFYEENINNVNANLRMEFYTYGSYEWLAFRLDLLGVVFLCIATMLMIFLPSAIMKPGAPSYLFIINFWLKIQEFLLAMKQVSH